MLMTTTLSVDVIVCLWRTLFLLLYCSCSVLESWVVVDYDGTNARERDRLGGGECVSVCGGEWRLPHSSNFNSAVSF